MTIVGNKKLLVRVLISASVLILTLVLIMIRIYPLLTQEENTISIINGIVKLNLKASDIYEYDADSTCKYYITKAKDDDEPIRLMLENGGWIFSDQLGSAFIFEKSTDNTEHLTVSSRQFSRYFRLWIVPEPTN